LALVESGSIQVFRRLQIFNLQVPSIVGCAIRVPANDQR